MIVPVAVFAVLAARQAEAPVVLVEKAKALLGLISNQGVAWLALRFHTGYPVEENVVSKRNPTLVFVRCSGKISVDSEIP